MREGEARTGLAEHWEPQPERQAKLRQHHPWGAAARWTSHSASLRRSLHRSWAVRRSKEVPFLSSAHEQGPTTPTSPQDCLS